MDGWTANEFHCCSLHIHLGHARSGTAMLMHVVNPADVVPGIPNNSFDGAVDPVLKDASPSTPPFLLLLV